MVFEQSQNSKPCVFDTIALLGMVCCRLYKCIGAAELTSGFWCAITVTNCFGVRAGLLPPAR